MSIPKTVHMHSFQMWFSNMKVSLSEKLVLSSEIKKNGFWEFFFNKNTAT